MADVLVGAGFQFIGINDSSKAITTIVSNNPALIFLDLGMSGVSSYEICSEIRKISRFQLTPIILWTAKDGLIEKMRAKMAGASDLITNPITSGINGSIDRNFILQIAYKYTQVDQLGQA